MKMAGERWADIPGFDGAYQVSTLGRVRSVTRTVHFQKSNRASGYKRTLTGRILRPGASGDFGYPSVVLGRRGGTRLIHSLVLSAFVGARPDGMDVRHLNGNPCDCRLANLRYGTRTENNIDISRHGRRKFDADEVRRLRVEAGSGVTQREIARRYNVAESTVSAIVKRRFYAWVK